MEQEAIYFSINVAKAPLNIAIRSMEYRWSVAHDEKGVSELVPHLKAVDPTAVSLEATGGVDYSPCRRNWSPRPCPWL